MELILNWQDMDLICGFCGTKKSVKYKVPVMILDTIPSGGKILLEKYVHVINVL